MTTDRTYPIQDVVQLKRKMLGWVSRFSIFCFLDNQDYALEPHRHDCLLAAGAEARINTYDPSALDAFLRGGWAFGHLSYDLKEDLHGLPNRHPARFRFPSLFFFHPSIVIRIQGNTAHIEAADPHAVWKEIDAQPVLIPAPQPALRLQPRLRHDEYIDQIQRLKTHIARGDCYEINFCQEFFAEDALIDPLTVYQQLVERSPNPFAAFYRYEDQYLVCASPERYLMKSGNRLLSQPMKGTQARDTADVANDERLRAALEGSAKDRSENVMVVDLVRNDLSRVCREGSVQVDELFGVYAYPLVYQMISTITGELREGVGFSEILQATFPMGSMTGAPKKRVMELIDRYESAARGIFSGAVGYVDPDGDFDFNVVIRSLMYNAADRYLSYQVGSGITFYSDPESEWQECLIKGEAIRKVLQGSV